MKREETTQPQPLEILRAAIFHTPGNPFLDPGALASHPDGGLVIRDGVIAACGDYPAIRAKFPDAPVRDLRGGYLIPGLVDTHIHLPQTRVLGNFGYPLLEWLDRFTLPEEARFADPAYAAARSTEFLRLLAAHGTTTALVFGAHFHSAMSAFFEAAAGSGLRIFAGLALADRRLLEPLHQTPEAAYRDSSDLIRRFHHCGRLRYAVTPRFALSSSEAILAVCQTLLREHPDVAFTTHINENPDEIAEVTKLFPWSKNYLDVYRHFDLIGRRSVLAHNVHPADAELSCLAAAQASIAHCPCSNAALGSGILPFRRHLRHGVRVALGTDVGGGAGFSILKEGLQAYSLQMIAPEPVSLTAGQLLYLATRAGAEALAVDGETGDFTPGKSADFVYLKPPDGSALAAATDHDEDPERVLGAIFTLADTSSIAEVRVANSRVAGSQVA
jgi:guanine deaminase